MLLTNLAEEENVTGVVLLFDTRFARYRFLAMYYTMFFYKNIHYKNIKAQIG